VSVHYVELADYLAIAAEITGLDTPTLIRVTKVDLAESALHAPAAGFGETEQRLDLKTTPTIDDAEPAPPFGGGRGEDEPSDECRAPQRDLLRHEAPDGEP
jgi:hypothetical protein